MSRVTFAFCLLLFAFCLFPVRAQQSPRTLVLDDFESASRWTPAAALSREQAAHGAQSAVLRFEKPRVDFSLTSFPRDWRGHDRLLFDVYSGRDGIGTLSLRICDEAGPKDCFQAENKVVVQRGWNHAEVKLSALPAASSLRNLSLDRIGRIALWAERVRLPWTVQVDNFRLVAGREPAATASRTEPQDILTIIDGRWFTARQVARPEDVPESRRVAQLRVDAAREAERLREAIRAARLQGIETIYSERHLVTADLGLHVRPRLPWYNNDARKKELFEYVAASCRDARRALDDLLDGAQRLPHVDDTQAGEPLVPPYPPLKGSPIRDWFFVDPRGRPMIVISLHSPSEQLERFFASPRQHIESYSVGGGSRWTIDESPVYEVFQKYANARRVGWDGWCGHLVRDLDSMGGTKMENTVICLESPKIQEAVGEYIRINIPKFHDNPQLLYNILAYELMYICYCDRSQQMFREWLKGKHGAVENANQAWGTNYRDFAEVAAPPVKNSCPLPGTNRALWYDWARFNMDRFTDYLLWVKSRVRAVDASVPLAAGGSSSMLAGRTGTTGIDEERIVNEVDDVIIHEGGGSTLGVDLQLALSERKKPLADPEMALESVYDLLPHVLHGKTVMQFFHWPAQPQNEYFSMNETALGHSWRHSLADIGELLRATLDARRLSREIGAFVNAPAEVAILYSQTATLQLPPEMLTWSVTPYLAELENTYGAGRYLDAKVTFVTERQIRNGRLGRYKLLLVPAVRNLPADVVEKISEFVAAGGRVVLTGESLLADEYNRPRDYLAKLGIRVTKTQRPEPAKPGVMVRGYDQSFSEEVAFGKRATSAAGVSRTPLGRGVIYYSESAIEARAYARFLDTVYDEASVSRPIRVRTANTSQWQIESRSTQLGSRKLLYVINFHDAPATLRIDARLHDLRQLWQAAKPLGPEVVLPPGQTAIYELQ